MSRALLIGINYTNTPNQLQGCIYDVIEIKSLLIDAYGFSPNTIITLRDDDPANMPTRARILQEIRALIANGTNIFLHYSGHGTQVTDTDEEVDRLDECIVPSDYASAGYIKDDELNALIKGLKGSGIALFDCCRSGTILDLPYTDIDQNNLSSSQGFYCFSGCLDSQDTYESTTSTQGSGTGLPQGSTTMAFISTVRALNYYPTISTLLSAMTTNLAQGGYNQIPQLTSTVLVGSATPFPFNSPNQQLVIAQGLIRQQQTQMEALQSQVLELQTQVNQLHPQAALVPTLQDQVQTLSVLQADLTKRQIQDASNTLLIQRLQEQVDTIPELQTRADSAQYLQTQISLIPDLQNQMESMMCQLVVQEALQKTILSLQAYSGQLQERIDKQSVVQESLQNQLASEISVQKSLQNQITQLQEHISALQSQLIDQASLQERMNVLESQLEQQRLVVINSKADKDTLPIDT